MASFYASMGTFLGGVITIVLVKLLKADPSAEKTRSLIGVMQSFSAGVMIFMTCFHLIPESTETIGSHETMIYFFVGVLCFVVLDRFIIPEDHGHDHGDDQTSKVEEKSRAKGKGKETTIDKEVKFVDLWALHRTSVITFVAMALHNIPGNQN